MVRDEGAPFYKEPVRGPADVFRLLADEARSWDRERFLNLLLDGRHRTIGLDEVSVGTATASLVHPREIFKPVILANACGFILIHNHPSGDPNPSQEDRDITNRLKEAAALMGVPLLDHIVLGEKGFFSFADTDATWKS
jgi:DNA repair protein RadC